MNLNHNFKRELWGKPHMRKRETHVNSFGTVSSEPINLAISQVSYLSLCTPQESQDRRDSASRSLTFHLFFCLC